MPLSRNPLSTAGFLALWHPELMLSTLIMAFVYLQLTGPMRGRFPGSSALPGRRRLAFLGGLAAMYVAQGSPLALLANRYLFSAHVLQMSLLVFATPPLLLAGTPDWLLRPALQVPAIRRWLPWLTSPVRALGWFIVIFSLYLMPGLTDGALANNWLYLLEHTLTVGAALLMWWPVRSPLPEVPRLPEPVQLLYTFLIELGMTAAFALVTFAPVPIYPTYAAAPRVIGLLNPLTDQQMGGIIMRLSSMASFGVIMITAFFHWANRDAARPTYPQAADPQ